MKRAQGLSINVIILLALGLIVLVIFGVMLTQRTSMFGKGLKNISEQRCSPPNEKAMIGSDCDVIYGTFTDLGPDDVCCKKDTVRRRANQ